MIREMKFQVPSSRPNKYDLNINDKFSPRSVDVSSNNIYDKYNCEKTAEGSLESTFYRSIAGKNLEREENRSDNPKFYIENNYTINKVNSDDKKNQNSLYFSKQYLKESNKNFLLNSIFNETSFAKQKKELKKTNSQKNTKFYNFDKSICIDDNFKEMKSLVGELRTSVMDNLSKNIGSKTTLNKNLEINLNALCNRSRMSRKSLDQSINNIVNLQTQNSKLEFFTDRIEKENFCIKKEIYLLKKQIENTRSEIYDRVKETQNILYCINTEESDLFYLQEEKKRIMKKLIENDFEKKNMKAMIINLKKSNDKLKEKVVSENKKNREFVNDVSVLLQRGKFN